MAANTKYKIEVMASAVNCWHWRLKSARNGQILATSETYGTKAAALSTVRAIIKGLVPETPELLPITVLDEAG